MIEQIPIAAGGPLFEQRVTLAGEDFVLRFDYHEREDRWYLSVYDAAGASVRRGLKVACDLGILRLASSTNRPRGILVFFDATAEREGVAYHDLARRVSLWFLSDFDNDPTMVDYFQLSPLL